MTLTLTCIIVEQLGESKLIILSGGGDGIAEVDIKVKNPELQKLFERGKEYTVQIKPV